MKIEKICEYFNNIGILQLESIDNFLKIYSQLSQNKYKNKSDKVILALFSYINLISKNDKLLYETCRNIVNNYSNNMILKRYHTLQIFINIIKTKLHSKYLLLFLKLNSYIPSEKRKYENRYLYTFERTNNSNSEKEAEIKNDFGDYAKNKYINSFSKVRNKINIMPNINNKFDKKPLIRKYKFLKDKSAYDREETFSPKIIYNTYQNDEIYKNINLNYLNKKYGFYSSLNNSMGNINNLYNSKIIPFKSSVNYGKNNIINNKIQKMEKNISNVGSNSKYFLRKNNVQVHENSFKQIPTSSYDNYDNKYKNFKDNNRYDIYYNNNDNYNFLQKEKDHIKKIQNKIEKLKLQKMYKISKECTFSPEINQKSKYIILNKNNNENYILTELNNFNKSQRNRSSNNFNRINNKNNYNIIIKDGKQNSKIKNNKITKEYEDDYYNIYQKKLDNNVNLNNKHRPRSYSCSKNNKYNHSNEDDTNNFHSIYQMRKGELSKLFNDKYPFMPNIKYNKNIKIKSSFDDRQKQFIKNKQRLNRLKEEEELKQIEEFNKKKRTKTDSKELVKRLYDKEAIKIKERLKKEKEEKLRKKNVINWEKRKRYYKEKYPDDFKSKTFNKNKKLNLNNLYDISQDKTDNSYEKDLSNKKGDRAIDFIFFDKNENDEKEGDENINDINKKKQLLIDKIKDEHIIGFKYNNASNIHNKNKTENLNNNISCNTYIKKKINRNIKDNIKESLKDSNNERNKESNNLSLKNKINNEGEELFNIEEKKKYFENENLLNNLNKREGIKSIAFQNMIKKLNNKE